MKHKIIAIGFLGDLKCFLDKDIDESKSELRKYLLTPGMGFDEATIDEYIDSLTIKVIEFDDRFDVYDIKENND